jgi:hypothetical protein
MRLGRLFATFRRRSLRTLVRALTLRELLPLALAIFLMFAVLGPITDLMIGGRFRLAELVATCVFSGAIALFYASASLRWGWAWIFAALVLQFAWTSISRALFGPVPSAPPVDLLARLKLDAGLTMGLMAGSYSCFLWFINGTAARYLRARAEIELARDIHSVLVPPVSRSIGEYEFSGFSVPSGDVGGDLVDVVVQDDGADRWFGYVADVSGHGVSSGVVMGMFKSALRARLLEDGPIAALLRDLNAVLLPLKSGAMYVTVACVRGGGAGGALEYAVAGHLPILRIAAASGAVEEITTPQIPIGMFERFDYQSATLACAPGDLLVLITDGLTDVFDAADREFGLEAVKRILQESARLPLAEIADRVLAAARAHGVQIDDQTLLLIRRRA